VHHFNSPKAINRKGITWECNTKKIEEGLITVICISILFNGGEPCNFISICKIEFGSDERSRKIRLFVDELLNPLYSISEPGILKKFSMWDMV